MEPTPVKQNELENLSTFCCVHIEKNCGLLVATGSEDGVLNIWAVSQPVPLLTLETKRTPVSLAFDDQALFLMIGFTDGVAELWDLDEAKMIARVQQEQNPVTATSFLPSREFSFISALWCGTTISLWELNLEEKTALKTFYTGSPGHHLKFSPCGRWLVAAEESRVLIWNTVTGDLCTSIPIEKEHQVSCIEFHPTKLQLFIGTNKGSVYTYRMGSGEAPAPMKSSTGDLVALAFAYEGAIVCGIYSDSICILESDNDQFLPGSYQSAGWTNVRDCCISPNDQLIVYSSESSSNLQTWIVNLEDLESLPQDTPSVVDTQQDDELIDELLTSSYEMCSTLTTRLTNVKVANSYLTKRKITQAMDHLGAIANPSVTHDVLNQCLLKASNEEELAAMIKLEDLKVILPQLRTLLGSTQASHAKAALESLRLIVATFGPSIKSNGGLVHDSILSIKRQCFQLQSNSVLAPAARELSKTIVGM